MILFTQNVQRAPQKCILNGMEMTSNKTKKTGHNHPVSPTSVVTQSVQHQLLCLTFIDGMA